MTELLSDVRVSLRLLARSKGFACISILLLALGVGMNMSVFSLANCALFRPLTGVQNPDSLVMIGRTQNGHGFDNTSWATYSHLRANVKLLGGLAAYDVRPFSLAVDSKNERLMGFEVSANYFDIVGVQPALGRLFRRDEGQTPGKDAVAVLGYGYWQSHFGADPSIVGKEVRLNGHPFHIIGIAGPGFRGHEIRQGDMWMLYTAKSIFSGSEEDLTRFDWSAVTMVGRLNPGIDYRQSQQEITAVFYALQRQHPRELKNQGMWVTPYHPLGQADGRQMAIQIFSVFGLLCCLVLLSVCANLGGVVLARAIARQREFAIRMSIGASRWNIIRQMLIEASLLVIPAALLGFTISVWIGDMFLSNVPVDGFEVALNVSPDWRSIACLLFLSLFAMCSFVAFPAWQSTRVNLQPILKTGEGSVSLERSWAREALVFVQVFVCVILLSGAGLLGKTLWNLTKVDLHLRTDHLLSAAIDPGLNGYKETAQLALFNRLEERLDSLPGVQSASSTAMLPLSGGGIGLGGIYGGKVDKQKAISSDVSIVGPRYFETLGISILRGRGINAEDRKNSLRVAVVNETLASRLFGEEDPIGRSLLLDDDGKQVPLQIVGLARNSAYRMIGESPREMYYVPVQQQNFGRQQLILRTQGDPMTMLEPLKKAIAELDPDLPIFSIRTMDMQVQDAALPWRAMSIVATAAGSIAALVAVVGLFGLIAWTVNRRTREIGLKMALGAGTKVILEETVWRGARAAVIAAILGLVLSYLLAGQLRDFLFGIDPHDPFLYSSLCLAVAIVLLAAIAAPARRALKISPMAALRHD